MKLRLLAAALAALTLAAGAATAQDTQSEKGKLSYALGYDLGRNLAESGEQVDVNTVVQAVRDGFAKKDPTVPVDQLRSAVEGMQKRQQARMQAEFNKLAAANKTASDAFLAQNKAKSGVKTLPNGVQYRVIETGNGAKPTMNSDVQLQYKGSLPDGTVLIDTSQAREGQPAGPVSMKVSQIPLVGLRDALAQMPAGSRWEVVIPGDKAYGTNMQAGRMANQAVVFDVKLLSVK
ncbi:FKBP-type peptidyl-prolyl cis-trans isomerase N-terminal domain-containing protein [Luteimonas vadosa]|uniref:Peptidyl-prolyl cis-trans isomerase n=1 Tax=Luteimonas vadosa TaxID=1165507 RepID=A0ABP9E205_9GAMM